MKRTISILTLIFISYSFLYSQNWNLINPDFKYNYANNEYSWIANTIWVDSIQKMDNDTMFYLNRIVVECDTCPPYINDLPRYAFYNQPQFLQRQVNKTDSFYCFFEPNQFVIKQFANKSDKWIFDTINDISATVLDKIETTTFEQIDSTKIIGLSSGDTLIISKNFGILRFDDIYGDKKYLLKGIDEIIGESVPDFFDIYNFDVGDVFEYYGEIRRVETDPRIFKEKAEILDKRDNGNIIDYDVNVRYYNRAKYIPPWGEYSSDYAYSKIYIATWTFEYKANHPVNYFNNQLVNLIDVYKPDDIYSDFTSYSRMRCFEDRNEVYTKMITSIDSMDFYWISDSSNYLLGRFNPIYDNCFEYQYKEGLGEVYYVNSGFEWESTRELVAYKKGNDTIGNLTPDARLSLDIDKSENVGVLIYPNPAKDRIYIEIPENLSVKKISLIGINGINYLSTTSKSYMDIQHLKSGIYFLIIEFDTFKIRKLIIIDD